MLKQFNVYELDSLFVIVLQNNFFSELDQVLVASVKRNRNRILISDFQISVTLDDSSYFIDLLDIATISKKRLKRSSVANLISQRETIKLGLDLLIDGF
ncbi:MAG: CcdB family protein [Alteromonadaceae bacterium]|nr:CcdB family protein [Alteromonadaceae bacterium]